MSRGLSEWSACGTEEMIGLMRRSSACWGKADAVRVTRMTSSRSRGGDTIADGLTYENPTQLAKLILRASRWGACHKARPGAIEATQPRIGIIFARR